MTFQIELVSPEAITYQGEADMVIARTVGGGDSAFQPGHVPFFGVLAGGAVDVGRSDGDRDTFAVHRGVVQVAGTKISILSDGSEAAGDIDVERVRVAKAAAESALAADKDDKDAEGALSRAAIRLPVAGAEG